MTTTAPDRPRESLFTRDSRKLVGITILCLVLQTIGQNWSTGTRLPGGTAAAPAGQVSFHATPWSGWVLLTVAIVVAGFLVGVARRGAARWDQDRVLALTLGVVSGLTAFVWAVGLAQFFWVGWAVEHGVLHPFTIGDVAMTIERFTP
ncbi:hypothetical protein [Curtobacterium sp. ISL-83]|uniref:hypothetical protein n=1 Tax=Curtobacterium sp. ISL-83 TaxID=2819145 RepID=UPI001BE65A09|nr:hypothetical protein [Curtobacterium sp. ISL-83]MBT2501826.1 hypothetical protein [Curtobacterium sp. ISL-83]